MPKVLVLMSTYNGARYVEEQLDSILSQNGIAVSVLIRDDGSSDNTRQLLELYASRYPSIEVLEGENVGWAKSFHQLTAHALQFYAQKVDYFAYSDQDDYWFPDKIISAVEFLEKQNGASLCVSNVTIADERLRPIKALNPPPPDGQKLAAILVDVFCQGCTFCFNRELLKLYGKYTNSAQLPYSHDRWILLIAVICGKLIYDPIPRMLYRQSDQNVFGALDMTRLPFKRRLQLMRQQKCVRSSQACMLFHALRNNGASVPRELQVFSEYNRSFVSKMRLILFWRRLGFTQPSLRKNIVTIIKIIIGFI